MHIETLKSLVASKGYREYPSMRGDWCLPNDVITQAIYDQPLNREDQAEAFLKSENVMIYDLNVWTCSDTLVGLRLVEVQGTPLAITWQSARKSPETMSFLSKDARAAFISRWDAYAVAPDAGLNILDDHQMCIPVAPPGDTPYPLNDGDDPRISAPSVAMIMDQMNAQNAEVDDPELISAMMAVLTDQITYNEATMKRFIEMKSLPADHMSAAEREKAHADVDKIVAEYREENDLLRDTMIPNLEKRASQIRHGSTPFNDF